MTADMMSKWAGWVERRSTLSKWISYFFFKSNNESIKSVTYLKTFSSVTSAFCGSCLPAPASSLMNWEQMTQECSSSLLLVIENWTGGGGGGAGWNESAPDAAGRLPLGGKEFLFITGQSLISLELPMTKLGRRGKRRVGSDVMGKSSTSPPWLPLTIWHMV